MQTSVGQIRQINRYPVKSMGGETLQECEIESYGLRGDRYCSFRDESKTEWFKYVTARSIPRMLTYEATFEENTIRVTGPDGKTYGWDEVLLDEIQGLTSTPISLSPLKAAHPEAQHPQLLSVDGASILLVTDSSLRKLESHWGKSLDQRRFRGNFVVNLHNEELDEHSWIGRQIAIGDALLQVDSYCERCVFVTMDPDTLEKDPLLLRKVNEEFNLHFGVYASVIQTGTIRLGDEVRLKG